MILKIFAGFKHKYIVHNILHEICVNPLKYMALICVCMSTLCKYATRS